MIFLARRGASLKLFGAFDILVHVFSICCNTFLIISLFSFSVSSAEDYDNGEIRDITHEEYMSAKTNNNFSQDFIYDDNGNIIYKQDVHKDEKGNIISTLDWIYDEKGNIISTLSWSYSYDDEHNLMHKYVKKDGNGDVIETEDKIWVSNDDDSLVWYHSVTRDDKGNVLFNHDCIDAYNEIGNRISSDCIGSDDSASSERWSYYENGKLSSSYYFNVGENDIHERTEYFARNGVRIGDYDFFSHGPDYWASKSEEYDENGKLLLRMTEDNECITIMLNK